MLNVLVKRDTDNLSIEDLLNKDKHLLVDELRNDVKVTFEDLPEDVHLEVTFNPSANKKMDVNYKFDNELSPLSMLLAIKKNSLDNFKS